MFAIILVYICLEAGFSFPEGRLRIHLWKFMIPLISLRLHRREVLCIASLNCSLLSGFCS
jgi:hypothetical protein